VKVFGIYFLEDFHLLLEKIRSQEHYKGRLELEVTRREREASPGVGSPQGKGGGGASR
jgi:hypothetical protein